MHVGKRKNKFLYENGGKALLCYVISRLFNCYNYITKFCCNSFSRISACSEFDYKEINQEVSSKICPVFCNICSETQENAVRLKNKHTHT